MILRVTIEVKATAGLADEELIDIVGRSEFERIKKENPGGLFKAFVLAQEGESNPRVIGKGQKKISWDKKAIQSAFNAVRNGLKFFNKHNSDSSTVVREKYGEIVGKTQKIIDDKLSTVVVGWFDSDHKEAAEKSDIVSMEAFWNIIDTGAELIAEGVDRITGIALGESATETPGFPGATQLASVQAYNEGATVAEPQTTKEIGFHELKEHIRRMNIFPTQLFEMSEIIGQRVDTKTGYKWIGGDREIHRYIDENVISNSGAELEAANKRIAELETAAKEATQKAARAEAGPRVLEILKAKNAPERVIARAQKKLDTLTIGDDIEQSLNEFADGFINEDKELIELGYGVAEAPEAPSLGAGEDPPEKNPFLPEDEQ